jgi:hypothetical protein
MRDSPVSAEVDLRHLRRMTSRAGLWQHARGASPDRAFGLCTDDNARALMAMVMHHALFGDPAVLPLADRYLAFLEQAFDHIKFGFRNFRTHGGDWLETADNEDAHGRCLWALALVLQSGHARAWGPRAQRLFDLGVRGASGFRHPRPWAFAILACDHALRAGADPPQVRQCLLASARMLHETLRSHACDGWFWFEYHVTYANARLPHALARAGVVLGDAGMVRDAVAAMRWLVQRQMTPAGALTVVGNDGWMTWRGRRAAFDQQPIEAMCLVQAAAALAEIESAEWRDVARRCYAWFLGENDLGLPMIDPATGGCFDGLTATGVNTNQGAESLLAWLIARLTMLATDRRDGNSN